VTYCFHFFCTYFSMPAFHRRTDDGDGDGERQTANGDGKRRRQWFEVVPDARGASRRARRPAGRENWAEIHAHEAQPQRWVDASARNLFEPAVREASETSGKPSGASGKPSGASGKPSGASGKPSGASGKPSDPSLAQSSAPWNAHRHALFDLAGGESAARLRQPRLGAVPAEIEEDGDTGGHRTSAVRGGKAPRKADDVRKKNRRVHRLSNVYPTPKSRSIDLHSLRGAPRWTRLSLLSSRN
jgi:hypothetical protein